MMASVVVVGIIAIHGVIQIHAFSSNTFSTPKTTAFTTTTTTISSSLSSSFLSATTAATTTATTTTTTSDIANDKSVALDWSFLDGVYLIHCPNGNAAAQRLSSTETILNNVNLLDKTILKEFQTDDENRIRGCYTSHLSVYRDILRDIDNNQKNNNRPIFDFRLPFSGSNFLLFNDRTDQRNNRLGSADKKVLILEDNLALNGSGGCDNGNSIISQKAINSIATFVESNSSWDVMHLAYIPYVPDLQISRTDNKDIVKLSTGTGSALGTTAYIINTQAMQRLVQEDDENGFQLPIPDVMAKLFGESRYASNPTLFVRAPSTKSLVNPQLDDLREILFQPVVTAFAQRLLVWTGLSTNALLPIVVAALLTTSIASIQTTVESIFQYWNTGSFDGPWIVPLLSVPLSLFSLALIVQGALLAPPKQDNSHSQQQS
ncbi:hypothetical protein IV203_030695 [Nitzschia inconspicua]|uniref:Uncharacterized protein n=1 Tax=Nitzschia inconspicua TaxID=303405 RepID=A0A9K3LTL5_9STRA|nr:hypothetical protein IV203_030695 [Nitzschia inconspicua]